MSGKVFHTSCDSVTPAGCPAVQLSSYTVYLVLASDPQTKISKPNCSLLACDTAKPISLHLAVLRESTAFICRVPGKEDGQLTGYQGRIFKGNFWGEGLLLMDFLLTFHGLFCGSSLNHQTYGCNQPGVYVLWSQWVTILHLGDSLSFYRATQRYVSD